MNKSTHPIPPWGQFQKGKEFDWAVPSAGWGSSVEYPALLPSDEKNEMSTTSLTDLITRYLNSCIFVSEPCRSCHTFELGETQFVFN